MFGGFQISERYRGEYNKESGLVEVINDEDETTMMCFCEDAFINREDAVALAEQIADFMTKIRMWS